MEDGPTSPAGSNRRLSRFIKGTTQPKPSNVDGEGLAAMLLHPLSVLLVCCPLGVASAYLHWDPVTTFFLNFVGLVPLAKILGDATEELAASLKNDMLAGLLNATFGNAVEVVIMVMTLKAGLVDVVKATLLGSVLSNLLLVLGCAFFFGGIIKNVREKKENEELRGNHEPMVTYQDSTERPEEILEREMLEKSGIEVTRMSFVGEKVQTFSVMSAMVNTSLLLLSCQSLALVTVFYSETHGHLAERGSRDPKAHSDHIIVEISRTCAIAMMLSYVAYIFFQLVTHRQAMAEDEGEEGEEDEEEPNLSMGTALTIMFVTTVFVAVASELLVDSLDEVVTKLKISTHFIGIVLLPIIGNACEHASAIRFAIQDKPGLSIGIAVGSSTQISLFVVPFSVLMGWFMDLPMDLNFGSLNTTVLSLSVVVVLSIVVDGAATWLQGYLLISAYLVIAVLYWHLPDKGVKTMV